MSDLKFTDIFEDDFEKRYPSDTTLMIAHLAEKQGFSVEEIRSKQDFFIQSQKNEFTRKIDTLFNSIQLVESKFEKNGYFSGPVQYEDSSVIFSKARLKEALNLIYFIYEYLITKKKYLPFPSILPVSDGSYDIEIESEKIGILISIPNDNSEKIDVYGETYDADNAEITILDKSIKSVENVLLEWIEQNC
ncbi:MAG: hypothetical protein ACTSYI_17055 [Promethearchaeota archaeon]